MIPEAAKVLELGAQADHDDRGNARQADLSRETVIAVAPIDLAGERGGSCLTPYCRAPPGHRQSNFNHDSGSVLAGEAGMGLTVPDTGGSLPERDCGR
jgi:hypothetical protein